MFDTALSYVSNGFVAAAIGLVVGVLFSQKIKDWFAGIDSETRSGVKAFEAQLKTEFAAARASVLQLHGISALVPAAKAAPLAPAAALVPLTPASQMAQAQVEAPKAPLAPTA